jgi:alkylhydroperoxidase/carboxymuconolactone decarboxylase family protein YurZ
VSTERTKDERVEHYVETMGRLTPGIETLFDMDPEFAGHYTDLRELIYRDRADGLSLAMKELLIVLLDVSVSNPDGAINHLRAARQNGLTRTQLQEMIYACFLVRGVSSWGMANVKLWRQWCEWDAEDA